jgi:hypothetical protein
MSSCETRSKINFQKNSELKTGDFLENLGESELREALLRKSEYLATIGDKTGAIEVQETSRLLV